MDIKNLKYDSNGLIPAIIQDWKNGDVLMHAYMNEESLKKTIETGYTHFWSRSRGKLWKKGETSGNEQIVKEINYDCDNDKILKKIGEEASEVVIGSKNDKKEEIIYEIADLWFHSLVLLGYHDITPEDIYKELQKRFGKSGIRDEKK